MNSKNTSPSKKDEQFRDFSLNGSMWKVVLYVGAPLALFQSLNQIFKIMDSMMASHINATAASTVAYLSQLTMILMAMGTGLSVGSGLKISEAYGSGDYELVKKRVNNLFALSAVLGLIILLGIMPFTEPLLRLAKTPEEFISMGKAYFLIELFSLIFNIFNNVYISIERARGNSKRILYLNLVVILVKFTLTAVCVYIFQFGITAIAAATLASQLFITAAALVNLTKKESAFSISIKYLPLKKKIALPMVRLSIPVAIEKAAFSLGKAVINSMSTGYGAVTVGALGISNNLTGINTMPQNGFQDGAAAIISQNLGAGKTRRALNAFYTAVLINLLLGAILMIPSLIFSNPITSIFASGDEEFQVMLKMIYYYDIWSTVPLGINSAILALFYGFGKTKVTLVINFCRVFLFRIPVLWYFQRFTNLGSESVGIVMVVSNLSVCILSMIFAFIFIRNVKKDYGV